MTRIGFAYNQKPEQAAALAMDESDAPRPEEDPPSTGRDDASRFTEAPTADAADSAASSANDLYAEWDSPQTIDAIASALAAYGEVIRLEASPEFPERLRETKPDLVFNIAEGLHGVNRESHVPAICEFLGVPYSGSDPLTLSLCLDKSRAKEILSYHRVPTAPFLLVDSAEDLDHLIAGALPLSPPSEIVPLFVKPVHEGSSKGITERNFVRNADELEAEVLFLLEKYQQPVLVEEFLPGAEFTCGVLGNGSEARVLPIVGMNFGALPRGAVPIYGFEAKWIWGRPESPLDIFACPAPIPESMRTAIERVVLRAYRVLGCRDWARVDVRLDADGVPNIVEVNPLPGILPDPADNSCLPKAARAAGLSYEELIQSCLLQSAERNGISMRRRGTRARRVAGGSSTQAVA
ncbi:MAG: D-alanine--D-alanine ligase [Gemmatimonadaceae bacterium]